ncbi:MAG TPA: hypothetical protein VM077_02725 [Candidatus Limnocylindrales bacterium]|nr:hypothetical protein [Candidatus Limnocylindrales bacterium]
MRIHKDVIKVLLVGLVLGVIALSVIKVDKPGREEKKSSASPASVSSASGDESKILLPIPEDSENVAAVGLNYVFQGKIKSYEKSDGEYKLTLETPNKNIPVFSIHEKVMVFTYENRVGTVATIDDIEVGKNVTVFTNYNIKSKEWSVGRVNVFLDQPGQVKQ